MSKGGIGLGWGNWPQKPGSEHYVRYDWDTEVTMDRFDIFWYDDEGGTRIPGSMKILYLAEDGKWKEAEMHTSFKNITAVDRYNTVRFAPITTSAVKLVLTVHQEAEANGIYRWKVSNTMSSTKERKPVQKNKTDRKFLKDAVQAADMFQDSKNYASQIWDAFQEALEHANEVYNSSSAKQDDIDTAVNRLNSAIRNLNSNCRNVVNKK